jgi:hypothetical protein
MPVTLPKTDYSKQIKSSLKLANENLKELSPFTGTGLYEKTWTPEEQFNIAKSKAIQLPKILI